MRHLARLLAGLCLLLAPWLAQAGLTDTGIVLLHGKEGMPQAKIYTSLISRLQGAGVHLVTPEMGWSRKRIYDANVATSMGEIEHQIGILLEQGAQRIVLVGHSMGANAALRYAATHPVDALVLLAPGHNPEQLGARQLAGEVERARQLIAAGKGAERTSFRDINVGHDLSVTTTAAIYLSWFDPDGDALMTKNAAALPPLPVLMQIGSQDPLRAGQQSLFGKIPAHPAKRLIELNADHKDVPEVGADALIDWLKSLPE